VSVLIRPREDRDLAACAELVRDVHAADRYPRYLPEDIRRFLVQEDAYRAWVADLDGQVVGHVALTPRGLEQSLKVASDALNMPPGQLAVVARLFVAPKARGQGAGRQLLDAATAEARARGLQPVLDVDKDLTAAIALYESRGWVRAGSVTVRFRDGSTLDEYVYYSRS
jgi:GNAT superfamily N-acetyltransferase